MNAVHNALNSAGYKEAICEYDLETLLSTFCGPKLIKPGTEGKYKACSVVGQINILNSFWMMHPPDYRGNQINAERCVQFLGEHMLPSRFLHEGVAKQCETTKKVFFYLSKAELLMHQ